MSESNYIDRPPRIQPVLPFDEITIPNPPDKQEDGRARLIQVALPLITIIGYIFVSAFGGRNPFLLVPMALSVVGSVGFSLYSYRKEQQRRAEVAKAYADRLVELNKDMHMYHDMQRRFYHYNYPDYRTIVRIVKHAGIEGEKTRRSLRSEARLWERRVADADFGVVRLGIGTLPSTVTYVLDNAENFDDPQVREAMKLAADSRYVSDIPVIISFRQPSGADTDEADEPEEQEETNQAPITHALGIAGECESVYSFVQSLLVNYIVFHAPMDARLYVLATRQKAWFWTKDAPHSQADEQNRFSCFIDAIKPDEQEKVFDNDEGGELEQFLEGIRKVLAQRKIRLQEHDENAGGSDPTLPFLLVVVDLLDAIFDQDSPLRAIESDAAISILLEEGAQLGAAVIFLVPERSKVPSGCRSVIEIEQTTPATNSKIAQHEKLHFRYAETGVNTFRYVGMADSIDAPAEMEDLARQLAALDVRQGSGASLTSSVPFLALMGYTSLEQLKDHAWGKWQDSTQPRYANWLRVKLGLMSGNKPRTLVFSAKRDGVHGMVAGSTGSGKSELLISLIIGMAVTYDPTLLNFVLVDYKGGGAFNDFKHLPHCVDIITNLAGDGVTRMFTAIQSEMQRRQVLNVETGTKNIVEYRQQGLHLTHHPYPYLFIIIDEFAEMIADRAEFRAQLESITRVGRAQGVSLILAAQRPSGVTDQMRSNIKFRICLRVETPGESREMLRRSDAAFLPTGVPGRGYLQVGNENIDLIQAAYTGEKYRDPHQMQPVIWPDRGGSYNVAQDQEPPELYKAIIDLLNDMAQQQRVPKQRAPWPDFLPTYLALSELLISQDPNAKAITSREYLAATDTATIMLGQEPEAELTLNPAVNRWLNGSSGWIDDLDWERYAMRPVIGLIDNPYAARQIPLTVDLPRGHAVLFGASGWGKTTFIRSLIVSLAATHTLNHFHAYVLDLGGRNLGVLEHLPHVGAMITPDEEGYKERVEQLLRELDDIIEKRKTLLNNAGVPDLYKYNRTYPESPQPAILVAIDNFVEFIETFGTENDDVESVLGKFVGLVRQAKPYGIHAVISVNQLGDLSSQVYSLFTERFTLKLADTTEYRAIVGGYVDDIGDIPGRGYTKIGRQALAFQVALPIDLRREGQAEPANENKELAQFAQNMHTYMTQSGRTYNRPIRVDALPKAVLFKHLLAREHQLELDTTFLDRLKAITRQKWTESSDPAHADWLKVTIGVISGNRPRPLHLEAKQDGVHGMIAGGTGSGKSELLMTLIVGLALNYDPSILNLVLVDYKGGGAFEPFRELPHCVDIVTNLNKAAVKRMFTAINAEMQRRQKLNAETHTKDIVEYRTRGLHRTHKAYPHLFIIIDEYAEMITDSPEFRDELDSITRVGRAQGVNLLLASQRPTGVSDQMRANIKLRICLRVEGVDTSREMLRRSDAAFLPNGMPGRGYLQVGNENIELIQVAYTGEKYEFAEAISGGEQPKFYDVVVHLANELLVEEKPRTPWPPFLSPMVTLSDPLKVGYVDRTYTPLMTLDRTNRLALNPFTQDWLNGAAAWHGMNWDKTALRAIAGLLDDPYNARQLPLVVDFTRGHAVLFGGSGWGKTTFMRSLIVSLASTHTPNEFHAHILDLGGRNLEVLSALPHVGTIIMPDERGYEERVQQLWRELNDILDQRKHRFSATGVATLQEYNSSQTGPIEPAILVAIDNFTEFIETFGNGVQKDTEGNPLETFVTLARQGKAYGLHFVISVNRLNAIASKLYSLFTERLTLRLADASEYSAIVGSNVDIEEMAGRGYTRVGRLPLAFQIALVPGAVDDQGRVRSEARQIRAIGQQMHEHIAQSGQHYQKPLRIDALPKSSSYRQVVAELFGIRHDDRTFLDALKAATQQEWERNALADHADWLRVTLGIASGNRKRTLKLEAKKDGVHGMIAGGTGSGKSELLMTMIVGLALHYPPDILNFVLVDYKGGGAFKPFERLPHCVDMVTNLNKAAVARMFTAINAEIRRRQALNAETGTKDIVEYREKGLHTTREPYPHLFIIIDEYAEMIDDNPDYRLELESITRVGRAQGVNLFLASQRPKGVSDQMRANIKLRLCLRVEQMDTSRELLRRPDAALLPNGLPGRGYLQVGNEPLELIQVAYTGEPQVDEREAPVFWPERFQTIIGTAREEVPKLYDAVVTLTTELVNGRMPPKPWPGFLSQNVSLETPLRDAKHNTFILESAVADWLNGDTGDLWTGVDWCSEAMRPIIGLVDDPSEARQDPLWFDLKRNHLAVFGDAGMGKTTLLRTLLVSLAVTHAPHEFHAYVLDLGGRNFRSLETFPHVGAVIYADDEAFEERLQRLFEKVTLMAEERQHILSNADVNSLYEFNERYPDQSLPAVVVVIDNIAELQENYETLVETTLLPLVRRAISVGITFVVAGNVPNNMPGKVYNLFGERVTCKQNNADRYMDIVGRGAIEIDDIPGRGYVRIGRKPLLFQVAQPSGRLREDGRPLRPEAEELRLMAAHMQAHPAAGEQWRTRPDPIHTLPETVPLVEMLPTTGSVPIRSIEAIVGKNSSLQPARFDLKRMGPHVMIVGPPLSGKTTLLYTWVFSLASRYAPTEVMFVLIDTQRKFAEYGGTSTLGDLPHVLATITEIEQVDALVTNVKRECEGLAARETNRAIFIVIDNFDDFSEEIERDRNLPRELASLARRYGRDGLHFVISGTFDGSPTELRRRIQSANYGIGLRTAQAVETLRVMRTPAILRSRELPAGRGYIVKSGQPDMIQVATPYEGSGLPGPNGASAGEEETRGRALDWWVQRICVQYPQQRACWITAPAQPAASPVGSAQQSKQLTRMLALLQIGMRREIECLQAGNGPETLITAKLLHTDMNRWQQEDVVKQLIKDLWYREKVASGLPEMVVDSLASGMDAESLVLELEAMFAGESGA